MSMVIDQFTGPSRIFDATMDGKLEVRDNGSSTMQDFLPYPPLPRGTTFEVKNASLGSMQEIRAQVGVSLDGIAAGYCVLGPTQSCAFVSDGSGNYLSLRKPIRAKFLTDTALYVNNIIGNDGYSGISPATPFRTIQAAMNASFINYDMGGLRYILQAADSVIPYAPVSIRGAMTGHYGSPQMIGPLASFTLLGNASDPSKVIIDGGSANAIEVLVGKSLHVDGVTLQSSAGNGVFAYLPGTEICMHDVHYGACGAAQIYAGEHATILIEADQHFLGDAAQVMYADVNSSISYAGQGLKLRFHGARTYSGFVVGAARNSTIDIHGLGMVVEPGGSVTGSKWKTLLNGVIDCGYGVDPDVFIPGSAPGSNNYGGRTWWP